MRLQYLLAALLAVSIMGAGCQKKKEAVGSPVMLGVTPWPSALTPEAVQKAYAFIARDCDFVSHHFDDGIPYDESFHHKAMPKTLTDEVAFRVAHTPAGKPVFLSVSALNLDRKSKSVYWKKQSAPSDSIQQYWESLSFDHPDIIRAYTNYVEYLVSAFHPKWINFGVESNLETWNDADFAKYKVFCAGVYQALKKAHPGVPVFLSLMVSESAKGLQFGRELMAYSDWVALSAYPYITISSSVGGNTDPNLFPAGYFEKWIDIDKAKPWCFAETGYTAENMDIPEYSLIKQGRPEWQTRYLEKIGDLLRSRKGQLAVWFCYADYDAIIPDLKKYGLYDPLFLFWKDIGLYDENGVARPALQTWRNLRLK